MLSLWWLDLCPRGHKHADSAGTNAGKDNMSFRVSSAKSLIYFQRLNRNAKSYIWQRFMRSYLQILLWNKSLTMILWWSLPLLLSLDSKIWDNVVLQGHIRASVPSLIHCIKTLAFELVNSLFIFPWPQRGTRWLECTDPSLEVRHDYNTWGLPMLEFSGP